MTQTIVGGNVTKPVFRMGGSERAESLGFRGDEWAAGKHSRWKWSIDSLNPESL